MLSGVYTRVSTARARVRSGVQQRRHLCLQVPPLLALGALPTGLVADLAHAVLGLGRGEALVLQLPEQALARER